MKIKILMLMIAFVFGLLPIHVFAQCTEGNCTDGKGTLIYPDKGMKYVGEFKYGKRHGKGILMMPDRETSRGQKQYEGQWKDNLPTGKGTLTFTDGRKFVGQWKTETLTSQREIQVGGEAKPATIRQVILSAQGTMYYPDGRKEVGEFKNDEFHKK